jgi:hypothetical protein
MPDFSSKLCSCSTFLEPTSSTNVLKNFTKALLLGKFLGLKSAVSLGTVKTALNCNKIKLTCSSSPSQQCFINLTQFTASTDNPLL